MPDITMCMGGKCPIKTNCYRYRAVPSEGRQYYFTTPPFKENSCTHFVENDGSLRTRNLDQIAEYSCDG